MEFNQPIINGPKTIECLSHGISEALINGKCRKCVSEKNSAESIAQAIHDHKQAKIKSFVPNRFMNCTFESYKTETEQQKTILSSLINWNRKSDILLLGKIGNGKTHLAIALIDQMLHSGINCQYIKFFNLTDLKIYDKDQFKRIKSVNLLVIDEYGRSESDFKSGLLFEILDHRYDNMLPTVIISNLDTKPFKESLNDAVYSRIRENCLHLVFNGEDYRLKGVK